MNINNFLRYTIIVLLILLAILSVTLKYDNCNKCSFEINNKTYDSSGFINLYIEKCLKPEPNLPLNFSLQLP